jgi:hypothetical protein
MAAPSHRESCAVSTSVSPLRSPAARKTRLPLCANVSVMPDRPAARPIERRPALSTWRLPLALGAVPAHVLILFTARAQAKSDAAASPAARAHCESCRLWHLGYIFSAPDWVLIALRQAPDRSRENSAAGVRTRLTGEIFRVSGESVGREGLAKRVDPRTAYLLALLLFVYLSQRRRTTAASLR